jgi:hypothetical protein
VYPESTALQQRKGFALLSAQLTYKFNAGWQPAVYCADHHVTQYGCLLTLWMQWFPNKVSMGLKLQQHERHRRFVPF